MNKAATLEPIERWLETEDHLRLVLVASALVLFLLGFGFNAYFIQATLENLYLQNILAVSYAPDVEFAEACARMLSEDNRPVLKTTALGGITLLMFWISKITAGIRRAEELPKKKIGLVLLLVVGIAQTISLIYSASMFALNDPQFGAFLNDQNTTGWERVGGQLLGVLIDALIAITVSVLCLVELLILIFKYLEKRFATAMHTEMVHYSIARPIIFLFLLGVDFSAAFIPLHAENLYQPIFGLPKDVVIGLPISVLFFCVSITLIVSGIWLDRRGWHEPLLAGIALAGIGKFYAWLAPDVLQFIVATGFIGLGYGLAAMAAQGFVIAHTDNRNKAQGLAYLFAGLYAGNICGTAIGAMLAEHMGYGPVFLVGGLIVVVAFGFTLLCLGESFTKPKIDSSHQPASVKAEHVFRFLFNRNVLSLIFLSSLPAAIAVIGFLNYFSPVYLHRIGVSDSSIGAILMLYGVCTIYIAPLAGKAIDASDNKKLFIVLGCLIGGCAFLTFHFTQGVTATIIAVFLLGLSTCFLLPAQAAYTLMLNVTENLGPGKAIAIFRSTSRFGQMLGPVVFSWLMMATSDINESITYFGLVYLATALLFIVFAQRDRPA